MWLIICDCRWVGQLFAVFGCFVRCRWRFINNAPNPAPPLKFKRQPSACGNRNQSRVMCEERWPWGGFVIPSQRRPVRLFYRTCLLLAYGIRFKTFCTAEPSSQTFIHFWKSCGKTINESVVFFWNEQAVQAEPVVVTETKQKERRWRRNRSSPTQQTLVGNKKKYKE